MLAAQLLEAMKALLYEHALFLIAVFHSFGYLWFTYYQRGLKIIVECASQQGACNFVRRGHTSVHDTLLPIPRQVALIECQTRLHPSHPIAWAEHNIHYRKE